jgi:serine protease Do
VVGINTAINPQGKGIGFAIPIDAVKDVVPQLIATGHVARGRLGVVIQGMDEDLAKAVGLDHPHGALVEDVEADSPAAKAGIQAGDVIVAVDGSDVPHSEDLPRLVARHAPGSHVRVTVQHDKQQREVDVTLASLKDEGETSASGTHGPSTGSSGGSALGIGVGDDEGHVVVERVAPDGPSDGKLRPGDVIEEIDHQTVRSASDLAAKVQASASRHPVVLLKVKRGDQSRYVAIERRG